MRSERVYFHRVLGAARGAKNAQSDNIMLHKVPQRLLLVGHDLRRRWLCEWTVSRLTHWSSSSLQLLLHSALLQWSDHHWLGPILRETANRIDHLIRIVFAVATNDRRIIIIIAQNWFKGAANGVFNPLSGEEQLKVLISWPGKIYPAKQVEWLAEGLLLRDGQSDALVLVLHLGLRLLGQVRLEGRICEDLLETHRSCGSRHVFQLLLSHHHSLLRRLQLRRSWRHSWIRTCCRAADLGRLLASKIHCCARVETWQEGLIHHVCGSAHIVVTAGALTLIACLVV